MLEHWPQGLQIGFRNSMLSFFSSLGLIQGQKVQHLLLVRERLKMFFSILALTPNVKRALLSYLIS
jgi:hypothetical protein